MPRTIQTIRQFRTWDAAFLECRKLGRPVTVEVPVNDVFEVARITPRGRCRHLAYRRIGSPISNP